MKREKKAKKNRKEGGRGAGKERKTTRKVLKTKAVLCHRNDLQVERPGSPPQSWAIKRADRLGSGGQSQTGLAVEPRELPVTGDVKINLP